jgi:hypothetical protein
VLVRPRFAGACRISWAVVSIRCPSSALRRALATPRRDRRARLDAKAWGRVATACLRQRDVVTGATS